MFETRILRSFVCALMIIALFTNIAMTNETEYQEKTKEEVDAVIAEAGSSTPQWWDSVELSIPENLDTEWPVSQTFFQQRTGRREEGRGGPGGPEGRGGPERLEGRGGPERLEGRGGPEGPEGRGGPDGFVFNESSITNVDEYLIQVIYPNVSRHKAGIKLVNHLMILHQDDQQKLQRSLNVLGIMFYELLDDYARSAFWWQMYEQRGGSADDLKMARCYYELGSRETSVELLSQVSMDYSNRKDLIKLWAKIGEVDKALEMIETSTDISNPFMGRGGPPPGSGGSSQSGDYLLAAEILKGAGRYDEALSYYEKVLALPDSETRPFNHHETDDKIEANYNTEAVKLLKALDIQRVPDGSYTATVGAYGGPMTVRVVVSDNKIESIEITQHRETPSYLIMAEPTARQIVTKQAFEGVDVISGATVTSDAIIHAAAKALVEAME